ncbi:MAG: AMP-binding protein [Betaproteobacteria bacterium]|nr:AMP-binding protein [Betaproteobacteria bacterium]
MILGRCLARNALLYPDKPAIVSADGSTLTHAALAERVNRLANALAAEGMAKGDKIAILARNSPEYLQVYFAAAKIGAPMVPINFQLKAPDIHYRLEHSDARALVVESEFLGLLDGLPDGAREALGARIFVRGGDGARARALDELIDSAPATEPEATLSPEDTLYIGYTSGTTGPSKGALVSHRAIVAGYLYKALDYRLGRRDVNLDPGPFWHSAPRDFASLAIYLGGTCVVTRGFEAREFYELVERHKVSNSFMVPTMYQLLTAFEDAGRYDASSLRVLISGGSPLPSAVKDRVVERFGPILHEFYGATETRIITNITATELSAHKRAVGRPIRDVELRILDEAGRDVSAGAVGEVFVRGPGLFSGYYKDPERTRKSHRGEWFSLGDLGRLDEQGYLYLVDRKQDMIISGGENIYPSDIEEVLLGFPGVKEAAVIGTPDETWGELVTAIVVPREGEAVPERELIEYCGARLPSYMKPRRVEFVAALPRNPVGKVLRRVLREPYWQGQEARI